MRDETYAFLNRPKVAETELRHLQLKWLTVHSAMVPGGIRYDLPRVQTSPEDRLLALAAEADELERLIATKTRALNALTRETIETVRRITDQHEARVIVLHYIDGMAYGEIAERLKRSERWVYDHRETGLSKLDEAFEGVTV